MDKHIDFVLALKEQLKKEFSVHDRKGVYAYTQKIMAYNSNKIEGSTLTSEQTASLFDTGSLVGDSDEIYRAKDIEEMTGHFKMFNEIIKSLDNPLTIEMIKLYHFQLKAGVLEDYANGLPSEDDIDLAYEATKAVREYTIGYMEERNKSNICKGEKGENKRVR